MTHTHANAGGSADSLPAKRIAAMLLLAQFCAMWGAFFVLAPAINWPASLGLPASEMLPLLLEQFGAVFSGYSLYLIHALLLVPLAVALHVALGLGGIAGGTATALGVLAGAAKALGIVRWLFLMPALAASWIAPDTTDATRAAIAVVFDAFNAYAGGVGELLGVGLFAGLWTVLLSIVLLRRGATLLAAFGFVAALGLLSTLPSVVGIESPILLTLSGIVWQFWTAALAIWLWRGGRETGR
ncbi:MAG: DUF4386 family protein [Pseudomonadota bacterium]